MGHRPAPAWDRVEAYDTATDTWRMLAPMPTARHGIQAAMHDGSAYIAAGGTTEGGSAPTDVQEVLTLVPAPGARPDGRIKLAGEPAALGNDVYNTTGVGQTRSVLAGRGSTRTFLVTVQTDGPARDSFRLRGPGGVPGLTVRYLAGASGSTDITAAVVAGRHLLRDVAPGAIRSLRLRVTVSAGAAAGSRSWLVSANSQADPSAQDAVAARVAVP